MEAGHIAAPDSLDVLVVGFAQIFPAADYLGTLVVVVVAIAAVAVAVIVAGAAAAAAAAAAAEYWPFVELFPFSRPQYPSLVGQTSGDRQ